VEAPTLLDLQKAIITHLHAWRAQDGDPLTPSYNWPGINNIVLNQDAVGWWAFLEGGVLHAGPAKQQQYYNWIKRRTTGKRWLTTLIKKLWEISWNMWEQRNGEEKNPESPASLREYARLDALITANYEDVSALTIQDQRWLRHLKEVLFTESLEYKHGWLEYVHLARIKYARQHQPPPRPNAPSCSRRFIADPHVGASTNYPPKQSLVSAVVGQPADTVLCTSPHTFRQSRSTRIFFN
jgi:hypothetical protein